MLPNDSMLPPGDAAAKASVLSVVKGSAGTDGIVRVPLWVLALDKPPMPHSWPTEDLVLTSNNY